MYDLAKCFFSEFKTKVTHACKMIFNHLFTFLRCFVAIFQETIVSYRFSLRTSTAANQ